MKDLKKIMQHLHKLGLFKEINHIDNASCDELMSDYEKAIQQTNFREAKQIAQKMSLLGEFIGLQHYFRLQLKTIEQELEAGELIGQSLLQSLGLIYFVEKQLTSEEERSMITSLKVEFLSLCSGTEIESIRFEADKLCQFYENEEEQITLGLGVK